MKVYLFLRYIAFGKTVAQLNVYTRKRAVLSEEPIWSISGDQGDRWRPAAVTISEYEDFQVCWFYTNRTKVLDYVNFFSSISEPKLPESNIIKIQS
jgi:hypothetical protein